MAIAVVGIIMSYKQPEKKNHAFTTTVLIVSGLIGTGIMSLARIRADAAHNAEVSQQRQDMTNLRVQNKSDLDAFSKRVDDRLNAIIDNSKSVDQKKAATQIKKELLYDPLILHRMTREQIVQATSQLTAGMVAVEQKYDEQMVHGYNGAALSSNDDRINRLNKLTDVRAEYETEFRNNYLNRACAVRDELLFRLRKTPEQSEKDVIASMNPMNQMLHANLPISRALGGTLVGPRPLSDAALYLDTIARQLN